MAKQLDASELIQKNYNILQLPDMFREHWSVNAEFLVIRFAHIRSATNIYIKYQAPFFWAIGEVYETGHVAWGTDDELYWCHTEHTAAAINKPVTGANYLDFWKELLS